MPDAYHFYSTQSSKYKCDGPRSIFQPSSHHPIYDIEVFFNGFEIIKVWKQAYRNSHLPPLSSDKEPVINGMIGLQGNSATKPESTTNHDELEPAMPPRLEKT